ncbi:MAG: type II toxin-antitoxin system death-on-curing family toxin [Verrucomicrobia bacterium]|nr:type II toxin-antitoxin system death-on-curing family toxin [Verrucomicrobiota bacterium]MCH8527293.1 type II toxin-antitoxin system death-on-curing family toxin [Kiritimatiellia bacterium]
MTELVWLGYEECLNCHSVLLARFGGLDGVRDQGLLESALQRPQNVWSYGSQNLFDMAAAYASGIVKNHPFLDGNKRTGFLAAALFLETNGYHFTAPEPEAVLMTVDLASGKIDAGLYARWLEVNSRPETD